MPSWELHQSVGQRVYSRPLGPLELGFYWDGQFQGTADTCQATEVQVQNHAMFSRSKVFQAWTRLKYMHPLLAARTMSLPVDDSTDETIHFVIEEERIRHHIPDEITFLSCSSAQEVLVFTVNIQNSSRLLSNDLLARLFIVTRTDASHLVHALTLVAHSITDGIANMTIMRTFLHLIATPEVQFAVPLPCKLEERLQLASAVEDLAPSSKQNISRQRWRNATGQIIASQRQARISGGHTLPRKFTRLTPTTPAVSCHLYTSFPVHESAAIIQQCRKYGVTFGNAFPVLGQIAMTRLLCKRRVLGEIPSEEWDWRAREPMLAAGPINLRPYLDNEWYINGGDANVSLAIGFFHYLLPFMTLGAAQKLVPGDRVPSFESLLSLKRFLHRSSLVKKQADKTLKHPLLLEIGNATKMARIQRLKGIVTESQRIVDGDISASMSPYEQSLLGPVVSIGGSSFGNVNCSLYWVDDCLSIVLFQSDHLMPLGYPLSGQGQEHLPRLHVLSSIVRLRCRPGELYLGASSSRKQLHLTIDYDGNVYESDIVQEWLEEVKTATKIYLLHLDGKL